MIRADPTGRFFVTAIIIGAIIGGSIGGIVAYHAGVDSGLEGTDLFLATAEGVLKGAVIGGVAGGIGGAAGGLITTYGVSSAAGTAALSAAGTISMTAAEVTILQIRKSSGDGDTGWQIASDCIHSIFNNGWKIAGLPISTKSATTVSSYAAKDLFDPAYRVIPLPFKNHLQSKSRTGKILSYAFVGLSCIYTAHAILVSDPVGWANIRGFTLQ